MTDDRQVAAEQLITDRVVASFADTPDDRTRLIFERLVHHLHAFIRDVRLTDAEWSMAVEFLTAVGRISTDTRQEMILLSDVLGASMQTITVQNPLRDDTPEATVFGPFFVEDAPRIEPGGDIARGATGQPCWVEGTVTGIDGEPVAGARVEVWEADEDGFYDVQYRDGRVAGRAYLLTDEHGGYRFWGLTPTPYPIPTDGPVGHLLTISRRSSFRAPHLHFMVTAPGKRRLVTHIFVAGGEYLSSDSVFGVKESLIKPFVQVPPGTPTPDGRVIHGTWARVRFDIVLADID